MKRRLWQVLGLAALFALASTLKGDDLDSNKIDQLMHRKLVDAQQILEGISVNDFDKISKNADDLIQVSKEVGWLVIKTPRYEIQSNEFRRAAENLIEKAKDKNLDGAALGYVDLTLSCVKCHKYVREVRMTRLVGDEPGN